MKWIAISGSWRCTNDQIESDVRETVRDIIANGNGIVCGGAAGVDCIAIDEALKFPSNKKRIKIFLPTSLEFYIQHNKRRALEGILTEESCSRLIKQLKNIYKIDNSSIIEGYDIPGKRYVEKWQYYKRNTSIVDKADELIAFHVNDSQGTRDVIEKAKIKGIPMTVFKYKII